jgi:glutamine amidotransferase
VAIALGEMSPLKPIEKPSLTARLAAGKINSPREHIHRSPIYLWVPTVRFSIHNLRMLAIIDYEMGNLRSVQKGFERVGHEAVVTSDPAVIAAARKLVLPGVGAFRDAKAALTARDLVEPIRDAVDAQKPFLGICLGLQLLFDRSFEDGQHEGLGILPGQVERFDVPADVKVPHMGWNQIEFRSRPPIFAGIDDGAHFYFVHSYFVAPHEASIVSTVTNYWQPFCSSVWRGNLFAVQFHPEKSQSDGLRLLKNFAELP